ncbi:MAG: hypothetical protein M5U32_17905 [Myxococcota bacterium]|nr:hypothetical protein [Myxococcota bacterium]
MPRLRSMRLRDLATALGRPVEGDGEFRVRAVAALADAGPADLAFVRSPALARVLAASGAGALIAPPGLDTGGARRCARRAQISTSPAPSRCCSNASRPPPASTRAPASLRMRGSMRALRSARWP